MKDLGRGWKNWVVILFLLITLLGCSNKVVDPHKAYTVVQERRAFLLDGDILYGKSHEIIFSFVTNDSAGMTPAMYVYGPINCSRNPFDGDILPDKSYRLNVKFSRPGQATIMFVWVSKDKITEPLLLHFEYDPEPTVD